MNFKKEIFKSVQTKVERTIANCKVDRACESVIKAITPKGDLLYRQDSQRKNSSMLYTGLEVKENEASMRACAYG